jgi:hypothetical protein
MPVIENGAGDCAAATLLRSGFPRFVSLSPNNLRVKKPLLGAGPPFSRPFAISSNRAGNGRSPMERRCSEVPQQQPLSLFSLCSRGCGKPVPEMAADYGNHCESKELKIVEGCVTEFWGGGRCAVSWILRA